MPQSTHAQMSRGYQAAHAFTLTALLLLLVSGALNLDPVMVAAVLGVLAGIPLMLTFGVRDVIRAFRADRTATTA